MSFISMSSLQYLSLGMVLTGLIILVIAWMMNRFYRQHLSMITNHRWSRMDDMADEIRGLVFTSPHPSFISKEAVLQVLEKYHV